MTAPVSPRPVTTGIPELVTRQRTRLTHERKQQLAADFEAMRTALLAHGHPETAHDFLDADADTAFPLPGVAHPKTEEVTA
jgi:hypothetical protein